ncbi:MAG: O-antigen ligase family protein [Nitrospirae bacterium]|nr:O-antigen ligase family protein [Nitrospirota bacterium]
MLGIAAVAFAPWKPQLGPIAFVALTYSVPRYSETFKGLLGTHILDWAAWLAFAGWLVWTLRSRTRLVLTSPLVLLMIAFAIWVGISAAAAAWAGPPWAPLPEHHPVQFVHAALLLMVAAHVLSSREAGWQFALAVCAAVTANALLQGVSGIYLEGDIAALSVIALSLAVLGARIAPNLPLRGLFVALGAALLVIFGSAQNRAAGVALVCALLAASWNMRHRWRWLAVGLPVVLVTVIVLLPAGYLHRFQAIWDPQANHPTAGLDRATVNERLELWRAGHRMVCDQPWLGVGIGRYPQVVGVNMGPMHDKYVAHNSLVHLAAETGIPGAALFVLLFAVAIVSLQRMLSAKVEDWRRADIIAVQVALVAYLAAGWFISRHDLVLAYILVGWAAALREFGRR